MEEEVPRTLSTLKCMKAERPRYSVTSLLTYEACPWQYFYAFVKRIPPPRTPAMMRGLDVHRLIARHLAQPSLVLPEAEPRTLELLERFMRSRFNRPPAAVEKPFALSLGPADVRGRIDVVLPGQERGLEIVDFKTGATRSRQQLEGHLQLPVYAIAASALFDVGPDDLAYTYYFLDSDKEVSFRSSRTEFDRTTERVESVMRSIQAGRFEPTPNCGCYACRSERRRRRG